MNENKKPDSSTSDIDSDSLFTSEIHESDEVSSTSQYNCLEIVEESEALETDSITESIDIRISPHNSTIELMTFQCADDFPTEFSYVADVEVKMNEDQDCVVSTTQNPVAKDLLTGDDPNTMEVKVYEVRSKTSLRDAPSSKKQAKKDLDSTVYENSVVSGSPKEQAHSSDSEGSPKCTAMARKEAKRAGNASSFAVESKIAQEIKEMKQREEEIRKMREIMAKENFQKPATISIVPAQPAKAESTKPPNETFKKEKARNSLSNSKVMAGGQSYNIASVFATKRKDSSLGKDNSPKSSPTPSSTYESPIEREIRIVREREEELKKERELALKMKFQLESCQQIVDFSEDEKDGTLDTLTSVSMCSDSSFDSGTKLTYPSQRGDYDDAVSPTSLNNKLNALYSNSSNAGSICSLDSISQSEKWSNMSGLQKMFSQNASSSKDSLLYSSSGRSPSPDSSSSSSFSKLSSPFNGQKPAGVVQGKNVNMERFIATKGKEITFKLPTSRNSVGDTEYYEIKPPQMKKSENMTQRKFLSAASKIQSELQEMKEREDELKKERANLSNLNRPNTVPSVVAMPATNANTNMTSSKDICTSSDGLDEGKEVPSENEKAESASSSTRRKSALIEEWERRIQSFGVQV